MAEAFKKLFLLHNRHNQMANHVRLLTCQKSSKIKASKIFFKKVSLNIRRPPGETNKDAKRL